MNGTATASTAYSIDSRQYAPQYLILMIAHSLVGTSPTVCSLLQPLLGVFATMVEDIGIAKLQWIDGLTVLDAEEALLLAHREIIL